MSRLIILIIIIILAMTIVGCSGHPTPQLIASYPSDGASVPSPDYGRPPVSAPPVQIVYNAWLELEVADPAFSAEQSEYIAHKYGGYLSSSRVWYQEGKPCYTVVLTVPSGNFDNLKAELIGLGSLKSESVSGDRVGYGTSEWVHFSQITLQLRSRAFVSTYLQTYSWNPWDALQQAFRVSALVFGFFFNVLIWIVVLLGPFVLLGWLVRKIYLNSKGKF